MLSRISNFFSGVKNKAIKHKEALKEVAMDVGVIAPYVVTDVLLYYSSYLNFLAKQASDPNHPENESWYFAAYCTGTVIISVVLAPALFLAFSDTAGRMLNIQDNDYRKFKAPIRKVIGLPGSGTKVVTGDASLYTYLISSQLPKNSAIGIACTAGIIALPALASFLWSNHDKSTKKPAKSVRERNIRLGKQALAYLTSACYAMDVGFVYFHSALNIPKNMGFLDHDLANYKNEAERAAYGVICVGTIIESIAVFLAFARLNANMFGLVYKEDNVEKGCWVALEESWIKKGVGSFAVIFKVFNTAVSAYNFFKNKLPLGGNISFVSYSSTAGIIAQSSLLISDPLNNQEADDEDQTPDIEANDPTEDNDKENSHASSQTSENSSSDPRVSIFENQTPRIAKMKEDNENERNSTQQEIKTTDDSSKVSSNFVDSDKNTLKEKPSELSIFKSSSSSLVIEHTEKSSKHVANSTIITAQEPVRGKHSTLRDLDSSSIVESSQEIDNEKSASYKR